MVPIAAAFDAAEAPSKEAVAGAQSRQSRKKGTTVEQERRKLCQDFIEYLKAHFSDVSTPPRTASEAKAPQHTRMLQTECDFG